MSLDHQPLTHEFQQIMQDLLHDQVREHAALFLFVRRSLGTGSVYFPMCYAVGEQLETPPPILRHYYLYSLQYRGIGDHGSLILDDSHGIDPLIRTGKLAVTLFPSGPVAVDLFGCDPISDVVLCNLTRAANHSVSTWAPKDSFRNACSKLVALWQDLAQSNVSFEQGTHVAVADTLGQLIADQHAQPPYFRTMHVRVDSRATRKADLQWGCWKTNSLSYNCFLMDRQEPLTEEYIRRMFVGNQRAYLDASIESRDPLVIAIVSVCDDFVHLIGEQPQSCTRIYARRNIAKGSYVGNPLRHPIVRQSYRSDDSVWTLLRSSLRHLQDDALHHDTALVTVWAGVVRQEDDVTILPVGFVPGGRTDLLNSVADHQGLLSQIVEEESPKLRLRLKVVLPSPAPDEVKADLHRLLDQAERAIPGAVWEPTYVGPFTLVVEETRIKVRDQAAGKTVVVDCQRPVGKLTYSFLRALVVRALADAPLSFSDFKGEVAQNVLKRRDHHRVTEDVTACLRSFGLPPTSLFEYLDGQLKWRLVLPKERVRIKKSGVSEIERRTGVVTKTEGVVTKEEYERAVSASVLRARARDLRNLRRWSDLTKRQQSVVLLHTSAPSSEDIDDYCRRNGMGRDDFERELRAAEEILRAREHDEVEEDAE